MSKYVPILRNSSFGFKEREVIQAADEAREAVSVWKEGILDEDFRFRRSSQRWLAVSKRQQEALSKPPEQILDYLNSIYDSTRELGEGGLKADQVAIEVHQKFPDFVDYYSLLRKKSWGYRLGQKVLSVRANESADWYDGKPSDISDAARRILIGQKVEVTPELLPGEDLWRVDLRKRTQEAFDYVAKVTDPKGGFNEHEYVVSETLRGITDKQFVFDLEDTAMDYIANLEHPSDRVFFADPYMQEVVMELVRNDNFVMFWTSAPDSALRRMQAAMPREMAALPAIGRDGWRSVVDIYITTFKGQMEDSQGLSTLQSIVPSTDKDGYLRGKSIFMMYNIPTLQAYYKDPEEFLRHIKYPQIFISPANGFFVDDNRSFIETAVRSGWPKDKVYQCGIRATKQRAENTAMAIRRAFVF